MNKRINFAEVLNTSQNELDQLLEEGRSLSWKNFGRTLKVYYPSKKFPSISVTGASCALNCLHCNKHYLKNMHQINSSDDLVNFAIELEKNQGKGILLSGGYDEESIVPLEPYLEAISCIKTETNLKINIHPGLVSSKQAQALANAGVDAVSFDLITDDEVISKVIKNDKQGKDYIESFESLINAGLHVVPHICLGLHFGEEKGNLDALETALKYEIPLIVFLGLIPTKGTIMENSKIINKDFLTRLILYTRLRKPALEQSLGCMRVRQIDYEQAAILAGINRIAVPKKKSIDFAERKFGLVVEQIETCCSI